MRRVLGCDGLIPSSPDPHGRMGQSSPEDVRAMAAWLRANQWAANPGEIVVEGKTPGEDPVKAAELVRPYAEAGATWWIEAMWDADMGQPEGAAQVLARLRQGPPHWGG